MTDEVQWLTTAPNPRSRATGSDAGQRGWKLHAVKASTKETFIDVKGRRALCGLRPRHGWGLDMFIEDRCERCVKITGDQTPKEAVTRAIQARMRGT